MIITIANMKGGCGKSTTADMMASILAEKGMKVLAVDGDWQSNLTQISGVNVEKKTLYDVIVNKVNPEDIIIMNTDRGYDIIPGDMKLMDLNRMAPTGSLKSAMSKLQIRYDYIIIDTPPTPGSQLKECLTAADCVIVPSQGNPHNRMSLQVLADEIEAVTQHNNFLYVAGVLQTFYNPKTINGNQTEEYLKAGLDTLKTTLFESRIFDHRMVDDFSMYTNSYNKFVDEFLRRQEANL